MCNLSQGIKEDGIAIGRAEGEAGIILKMYKNGFSVDQIAVATDKKAEAVRDMIAGKKLWILRKLGLAFPAKMRL